MIGEVFACFERHAKDSPYGMCQVMYGDWCDPIDMFGTNPIGDPQSRGRGRGTSVRLSAHVFQCLIEAIDTLEAPPVAEYLQQNGAMPDVGAWKAFAGTLRENIVKWAWEKGQGVNPGLRRLHPRIQGRRHGTRCMPTATRATRWAACGRTASSTSCPRRDLASNAYGLNMVTTQRDYLKPIACTPGDRRRHPRYDEQDIL